MKNCPLIQSSISNLVILLIVLFCLFVNTTTTARTPFKHTTSSSNILKTTINRFPVKIRSNHFDEVYLRMAGKNNPQINSKGFGTVNCQKRAGSYEIFILIRNNDGTYSFESKQFPGNYLRMAGNKNPQVKPHGFGTVNCQASIGPFEKFKINVLEECEQKGIITSIESAYFPNNFLRLNGGSNPKVNPNGFGTVNCQASIYSFEKFHLGGINESCEKLAQWLNPSTVTNGYITKIEYLEEIVEPNGKPVSISSSTQNSSSINQLSSLTLRKTLTKSSSRTWSKSTLVGISVSASANVGINWGVLSSQVSTTIMANLENTFTIGKTDGKSESTDFQKTVNINIPPRSIGTAKIILTPKRYRVKVRYTFQLKGTKKTVTEDAEIIVDTHQEGNAIIKVAPISNYNKNRLRDIKNKTIKLNE